MERLPSLLRFIDGVLTRAYLSEQKPGNTTQIHTLLILAEVPEVLLLCFIFFDEYLSSIRKKHLLLLLSFHILNVIQRGNLTNQIFSFVRNQAQSLCSAVFSSTLGKTGG